MPERYLLVLDARRTDDARSNIMMNLTGLGSDGQKLRDVLRVNEIDYRTRATVEMEPSRDLIVRVENEEAMVDYWLGVFPLGATIASPYFARTPKGTFAYVTIGGTNEVKVFRTDDFSQAATIPVGNLPHVKRRVLEAARGLERDHRKAGEE